MKIELIRVSDETFEVKIIKLIANLFKTKYNTDLWLKMNLFNHLFDYLLKKLKN